MIFPSWLLALYNAIVVFLDSSGLPWETAICIAFGITWGIYQAIKAFIK